VTAFINDGDIILWVALGWVVQATFTNNKFSAKANVVKSFLPVKEALEEVAEQYGEDEFGKKYNAIKGAFNSALKQLDVVEFTAEVGQPMDISRAVSVEEEYSDTSVRGTVLRPVKAGLELQGNVMQMASCVASLGSEAEAKAEEEAAAAKEAEATPEAEEASE
jgi:molecular chaperone GrpE (heat shock protein)